MKDDIFILELDKDESVFQKNPIPHHVLIQNKNKLRTQIKDSFASERLNVLTQFSISTALQPQMLMHIAESFESEYITKAILLGKYLGVSKIGKILNTEEGIKEQVFIHCKIIGCIMTSLEPDPFDKNGFITGKWLMGLESLPGPTVGIEFNRKGQCKVVHISQFETEKMDMYETLNDLIEKWGIIHLSWETDKKKTNWKVYYIENSNQFEC